MTAVIWCERCKLPLTDEESAGGQCALCGTPLDPAALTAAAEAAAPPAPRPPAPAPSLLTHWPLWAAAAPLVLLAGLVVALVVANSWPESPPGNNEEQAN